MNYGRSEHGIIKFGSDQYVFGGFNDHILLNSAERYNTALNTWHDVATMP